MTEIAAFHIASPTALSAVASYYRNAVETG